MKRLQWYDRSSWLICPWVFINTEPIRHTNMERNEWNRCKLSGIYFSTETCWCKISGRVMWTRFGVVQKLFSSTWAQFGEFQLSPDPVQQLKCRTCFCTETTDQSGMPSVELCNAFSRTKSRSLVFFFVYPSQYPVICQAFYWYQFPVYRSDSYPVDDRWWYCLVGGWRFATSRFCS